MEAKGVWGRVGGADVLVSGLTLLRGVTVAAAVMRDCVVLDAAEVWSSPSERLDSSRLSVRFPGTLVLFMGAGVFAVVPAAPVEEPLW